MTIKKCERCHREYSTESPGATETHGPKCSLKQSQLFSENCVSKVDLAYDVQHKEPSRKLVKDYLEKAYQRSYEFFPEKDMPSKIQADFGGNSWAIYLTDLFFQKGYKLHVPKESEGPDITLEFEGKMIYIEIINLNNNLDTKNAIPPITPGKGINFKEREPAIFNKIKKGIKAKIKQRKRWVKNNKIDPEAIFIVALNSSDLHPLDGHYNYPSGYRALYPVEDLTTKIKINDKEENPSSIIEQIVPVQKEVKFNDEIFMKDGFISNQLSDVSGIIYSDTHFVNSIENPGNEVWLILNAKAKKPIPNNFLSFGKTIDTKIIREHNDLEIEITVWEGSEKDSK